VPQKNTLLNVYGGTIIRHKIKWTYICGLKKLGKMWVVRKCGMKCSWAKKYTKNILEAKLYDPTLVHQCH
jgi:hypothetical protein